jgi:hypothetical protein
MQRLILKPSSSRFLTFSVKSRNILSVGTIRHHGKPVTRTDATDMQDEHEHDSILPRARRNVKSCLRDCTDLVEKKDVI